MDIYKRIKYYQTSSDKFQSYIFLDLASRLVESFPYRLNKKTYLLVPEERKELMEMAYEYLATNGKPMPIFLSLKILEIINKFNEMAQELGFTVITDMCEYKGDGDVYDLLGMDSNERGLVSEEDNNIPDTVVPLTLSVNEYAKNPFYPVVFKNITANRGEDKYLIENEEQLKKILALFDLPESKEINLKSEFAVQEYIRSFDGINSSLRVFVTCTGEIIMALFLVSTDRSPKKRIKKYGIGVFNPCEYLNDPSSPYYINSQNIISNAAGGGKIIPLNLETSNLTEEDKIILALHGIDFESLDLPQDVVLQCHKIASHWGSNKGIVLGIDFIYNSQNNRWYYLETNRNPSVEGYKRYMGLDGYLKKDIKTLMHLDALTKIVENIVTRDSSLEETKRHK